MATKKPEYLEIADKKTGEISAVIIRGGVDEKGHEVVSPVPMEPPVGWKPQLSMVDIVRAQVQQARMADKLREMDEMDESIEDADDFDIPDDPIDPTTPYENDRDPSIRELLKAGREALAEKVANEKRKADAVDEERRKSDRSVSTDRSDAQNGRSADKGSPPSDGPGSQSSQDGRGGAPVL